MAVLRQPWPYAALRRTAFVISKTPAGLSATVNQVTETDTAQAITARKTFAVGQVVETDTAQPIASVKVKTLGQATETDMGLAISVVGGAPPVYPDTIQTTVVAVSLATLVTAASLSTNITAAQHGTTVTQP